MRRALHFETVQEQQLVSAYCPHCAQSLAVPGQNLRTCVRCPRCREVLSLEAIVSRQTPLVPAHTWSSISLPSTKAKASEEHREKDVAGSWSVDDAETLRDIQSLFPD